MATTAAPPQKPYYNEDIDFTALATKDEAFSALLDSNGGRIDWQDPASVQYATPLHPPKTNPKPKNKTNIPKIDN